MKALDRRIGRLERVARPKLAAFAVVVVDDTNDRAEVERELAKFGPLAPDAHVLVIQRPSPE